MNNFYDDFLQDKGQLIALKEAYKNAFKAINNEIDYVDSLLTVSRIPTFKTIPYQKVNANKSCYTLEKLLSSNFESIGIPIEPMMSLNERIDVWENLSPAEKARIVDAAGYTLLLEIYAASDMELEGTDGLGADIQSFELYDCDYKLMIENVDYYFENNKIYLLKEYDLKDINSKRTLIFRNIVIDINTPHSRMGKDLGVEYNKVFSKFEFNEILKSFTMASLSGPKTKAMNDAFNEYTTLQGVKVIDYGSAKGINKLLWKDKKHGLGTFDFAVTIPISLLTNIEKLDMIKTLVSRIKPAFSDFQLVPHLGVVDANNLNKLNNKLCMATTMKFDDFIEYKDSDVNLICKINFSDIVKQTIAPAILDDPRFYTDIGIMLDYITIRDTPKNKIVGEFVSILTTTNQINKKSDRTVFAGLSQINENILCKETVARKIVKLNIFESERLRDSVGTSLNRKEKKSTILREVMNNLSWLKKK